MTQRDITLRLAVTDAERAIRDLRSFGDQGDAALKRIEASSAGAGKGLQSVNAAALALSRTAPQLGAALAALGAGAAGLAVAGIAALGTGLVIGTRNSEAAERSLLRLEGILRATGGAAGLTSGEIVALGEEMERTTLATGEAVVDAAAALATFKSISGDLFTDIIRLGQDSAATFGGTLTSNVVRFGKAFEDPIRGLSQLREVGISFGPVQEELIRGFVETGDKAEAQRLIFETLKGQIGDAGTAEAGGLTGAYAALRAELSDSLQDFAEVTGAASALESVLRSLTGVVGSIRSSFAADPLGDLSRIRGEIAALESELARGDPAAGLRGAALTALDQAETRERIAALEDEERAIRRTIIAKQGAIVVARETGRVAQETAELERQAAADEAAADELKKKADAERAKLDAAAATAAQRRQEAIQKALGALSVEVDQQQRLREALGESEAAHKSVAAAIEVENELRAVGLDLTSAQGQELARLVTLRQQEAEALERQANGQRFLAQVESDRIRRLEDRGFDPTSQNRDMAARSAEAEREVQRERDAAIARQVAALEGAIDRIAGTVSNTIRDFRLGLLDGAEDFAAAITDALASIPEQLAGTVFTSLFDGLIADFSAQLKAAAGPGGQLDFAAFAGAFNSPLGAAALGAFGGSLAANQFGVGGQFSGLFGGIGAAGGFVAGNALFPGVGGVPGALIGGSLGTLAGGLFGGGGGRDNVGTTIRLEDLAVRAGGTTNANTQRAQQLGAQVAALINGLKSQGIDFDDSGTIRFNVNNSRSDQDVFRGATRQVLERSSASDPILAQILATTRAQSPDALLGDIQFGRLFEQLTQAAGPAEIAFRELNTQFDEAARRARQLGLDEAALAAARQRATDELIRASEDQIRGAADSISSIFASRIGPLQGAIDGFQFGPGSALGVQTQLGLARSEFDLLSGRARSGQDVDFTRLASLGTQVVGLARELDASGGIFQSTFSDVDSVLRELIEGQTARQDDLLSSLPDALREAQRDQTAVLAARLDTLITEFAQLTRAVELQARVA